MFARKWCIAAATAAAAALGVGSAPVATAAPLSPERAAVQSVSLAAPATEPILVHDGGLQVPVAVPEDLLAPGAPRLSHIPGGLQLNFYDTNAGSATYKVTYRTPAGTEVHVKDLGQQTSYAATGLLSGFTYTFAVTSVREGVSTTVLLAKRTR